MGRTHIILSILVLMLGCKKDSKIDPVEVNAVVEAKATVIGYVIADYWTKGCSTGGLQIKVGDDFYLIVNSVAPEYSEPNSWPIAVLVRYESAPPDGCGHLKNRVNVISIQKR